MKNNKKGFTLIEILATIFILSIVLGIGGYYIINTINNTKEKSIKLTHANIKTAARVYVEENPKDIIWQQKDEEEKFSCISIDTLINKDLLKNDIKQNKDLPSNYIMVTKDENNNITSEQLTDNSNNKCKANIVEYPTSKNNCNNLTYNGTEQQLAYKNDEKFTFISNSAKDAGTHEVIVKPDDGYTWKDGTNSEYKITCTIKKAIPEITIEPNGTEIENITSGQALNTKITSNINGTISLKSSNANYAVVENINDNEIVANTPKEITIKTTSSRATQTYITITIIPNDKKNYYSSSTIYTIGNSAKLTIEIPTAEKYCNQNLRYNKNEQTLTKALNGNEGFRFYNNTGTEVGEYTVTAKLKYGYIWDVDSNEEALTDKTITCSIDNAIVTVTYNSNGGQSCSPNTKDVTHTKTYGDLCIPTRENYMFLGWYTAVEGGTKITKDSTVTIIDNHTLYAHWKAVSCTISYTGTMGANNWYKTTGTVNLSTTNLTDNDILEKGLTTSNTATFNNQISAPQSDTNNTTWYGYIKDINEHIITCKKEIKVDSTNPTCTNSGGSSTWTNQNKTITGTCSDKGSGCISNASKTFSTNTDTTTASPGTVTDNAGNSTTCPSDQIVKIDKTAPSCTSSGGSSTWTNQNKTITGTCSDTGGSGCASNVSKTYSTDTNTTTASPGTVKDNAGNSTTCPSNQTVKIDKTAPSCTNSGGSTSWTNQNKTITGTCSDTGGSGCVENVSKTYSTNTNTTTASPGTVKDNAGNSTTCPSDQTVKIDKTAPSCTNSGGSSTWTNGNITITGTCSDTGGSGCASNASKTYSTDTNTTTASPGTVKDNAGNSTTCPSNQTVKIDKTAPSCTSSGGSTTWTNQNKTITGTCSDTGGSGCVENVSKTYSTNTNTTTASPGTVKDNAGNSTTCPSDQTVKIDKTAPSCTNSGGSTTWTNQNKTITGTCSDTGGSGCAGNASKTYSTNTNTTTASPGTVKDNAGNSTTCPSDQTVKIDKTAPSCTNSGGSSTWTNGNITITGTCSDTGGSGCASNASKTYSTNTNTTTASPGTVKDNAGNSTTCPSDRTVKIDKTAPTCTNSGGSSTWTNGSRTITGTCSDTGGSGCVGNASKTYSTNTNTTTASPGTVKDNAGNSTTCPSDRTVKIDKTEPTMTISPASGTKYENVKGYLTVTSTCSDSGGSGKKSHSSTSTIYAPANGKKVTHTCTDNAGNSASISGTYYVPDYGQDADCGTYSCSCSGYCASGDVNCIVTSWSTSFKQYEAYGNACTNLKQDTIIEKWDCYTIGVEVGSSNNCECEIKKASACGCYNTCYHY